MSSRPPKDWIARVPEAFKHFNYINKSWLERAGYRRMPDAEGLRESGEVVLDGWIPPVPIIDKSTRVMAFGSCFAANFVQWLADHDFLSGGVDTAMDILVNNPFETAAAVAQQFRWAFGAVENENIYWVGQKREIVPATDESRAKMRRALEEADVFLCTFGHSEVWYDRETGEPLWRAPVDHEDESRFGFKAYRVADTLAELEAIERIRSRYLPDLKVIYTVSPQRIRGTFRPMSAPVANQIGKAVIRAALDEFYEAHSDLVNRTYFYFPGYEFVHELLPDPFEMDSLHLDERYVEYALEMFARYYTTYEGVGGLPPLQEVMNTGRDAREDERIQWLKSQIDRQATALTAAEQAVASLQPSPDAKRHLVRRLAGAYAKRTIAENVHMVVERLKTKARNAGHRGSTYTH